MIQPIARVFGLFWTICIVVVGGVSVLQAAAPKVAALQHPNVFVNARELDSLRLKLKAEPWRAKLFEQVKKDADAGNLVAAAVVYAITQDEVYGTKVRTQLVQQAKDFVPGRPDAQYPWGPEAGSAMAFDLVAPRMSAEEQQAVAGFLRQMVQDAIKYHMGQPLTPNMSFVCHWRIGLIGYALADKEIIEWAINDPGPPWGGNRPGRWGGFKQRVEHTLTDGAFWDEATIYGNFSILGMMYLAEAARHFDGTDLYNYTGPKGGSLRKAIAGLVSLAYPIERTGVGKGSVRMATWGDGSTAPPNRINNESGDAYFVNKPNIYPERQNLYPILEIAYHAWKDPLYAYLLSLNPNRDERLGWFEYLPVSLLLGETLPPETPSAAMPSAVYPETGIAVLRSDESPGYWTSRGLVAVQQMGRDYTHDHRDKFELMLWGRGRLLYPDWNAQQYEPMEYGWTRNGWAHSTLVVDESNPKGGSSTERHDFSRDAKFLATTSREIYQDVTQTRALLLADGYLLDLFWASSPRERTYDWFLHALGRLSLPLQNVFRPSQDLLKPYHWVDGERKWETDQTWCADFVQQSGGVLRGMGQFTDQWFNAKVGVRMTMLGEPGTAAYAGEGLFNPAPNLREHGNPEGTIPLVVTRRKARATCFAALHEPFDNRPSLAIRRVDRGPSAIGVCVSGASFTDYACVSFSAGQTDEPCTLTDAADRLQFLSFKNYAYLRVKQGKILARGQWQSFRVAVPEAAKAGAVTLNGKEVPYQKQGSYVLFNGPADPPHTSLRIVTAAVDRERVVPGQVVKVRVVVENSGIEKTPTGEVAVVAGDGLPWAAAKQAVKAMAPGKIAEMELAVGVPPDAALGTCRTLVVRALVEGRVTEATAGQVLVAPRVALAFSGERISLGKNQEALVDLIATNNAPEVQQISAEVVVPDGVVAQPGRVVFPAIEPGKQAVATVKLKGGGRDIAGEVVARVPGCEARLPLGVGVTIHDEQGHPLFPMWVVRAPGYEIQIHKKSGISRTLIGRHGQLLYGSEWWGGSGIFEVRLPTGAEQTAPFAWNREAKEIRWRGHTLEVTAKSGESFTATFGEHAIRYGFRGKPDLEYRAAIQSFFWHASGRLRTAKEQTAAGLPPTLGGFHWTYMQNPDLSPDCVVLVTPRRPAEWGYRPANGSPSWQLRDGDKFILLFGSEGEIRALAEEAVKD